MNIVFITSQNSPKDDFVKSLNQNTKGGVDLMIVVKRKKKSFIARVKSIYKQVGFSKFLLEMFYWFLLRIDKKTHSKLSYFKLADTKAIANQWLPKTIEVNDVNGGDVQKILKEISPDLIVIWNTPIIKEHILETAKKVINLHMGVCPAYRGAAANQFAVFNKDFSNIGATIHYVNGVLDGGDIIEIIKADTILPPKKLFKKLNNDAQKLFLKTATDIFYNNSIDQRNQNMSIGKNFALKYWTPQVRYKTAKIISNWEKSF